MTTLAIGLSLLLGALHVLAGRLRFLSGIPRSAFLSLAGGISVAYVFVQLLPELAEAAAEIREVAFEHGIYVIALLGLAAFYGIERASVRQRRDSRDGETGGALTWFSFASYAVYNAVIGYLLVREHRELSAVLLFAVAMGLHFVVNDFALREHHGKAYHRTGRWIVGAAVIAGALVGAFTEIHEVVIAALIAFITGGVVLNVMKEELPQERDSRFSAFLMGAAGYTALLLAI